MATLVIPSENKTVSNVSDIKAFLNERGVLFEQWEANVAFSDDADQETILAAYDHELKPFMQKNGFQSADVINVTRNIEGIEAIRQKFLKEHTHTEDEVRFFVDGYGDFWFHLDSDEVFCVKCTKGDFLSVPANTRHWFDLAPEYFVKAIRIFSNMEGWVAHYTDSGIDAQYIKN